MTKFWRVGFFILISFSASTWAQVRVHFDQPVGPPILGFGAQLNPYTYASPNWGDVTEENAKDFERKVIDLSPQFVRVFMVPGWKTGDPDGVNKQGNVGTWKSFLRTLRLAQTAGAHITLTTWFGEPMFPEKTAKTTAALLDDLINHEKITAIKSINMMNEPDMDWPGEENWTTEEYNRMYRTLDAELKRLGLRDRLMIVAGDMVEDYQPKWQKNIADHLADIIDGVSIHAYWKYNKTDWMLHRLGDTKKMAATQPSIRDKPFFVTEFGSQGLTNGNSKDEPWQDKEGHPICETTTQAMQIGWFNMEALNRGFSGTVQWDMADVAYDRHMHYGVIGEPKKGWPLKPAYFVLKMLTHTVGPGFRVVKVGGGIPDGLACALVGPKGEKAVYLLNRSAKQQKVLVDGFRSGMKLKQMIWNGDGAGHLEEKQIDGAGEMRIDLPAKGIVAFLSK